MNLHSLVSGPPEASQFNTAPRPALPVHVYGVTKYADERAHPHGHKGWDAETL